MTICSICKEEKGSDFRPNRTVCRICDNLIAKDKRIKDKEKIKPETIFCKICKQEKSNFRVNRKKCLDCEREHGKNYRKTTEKAKIWVENNKDKMSELQHKSYEKNKKKICEKRKDRLKTDHLYKLSDLHRNALRQLLKRSSKTSKYVNCTGERLINWIQYQFIDNMSFDNYGEVWVIDHVLPIKLFLSKESTDKIILNWINVKPVLKTFNLKKNEYIDKEQCNIHLENLKNYYKVRNLDIDTDYLQELENRIKI